MPNMRSLSLLLLCLTLLTSIQAYPGLLENLGLISSSPATGVYVKGDPSKGDVRSPCPALNVLANHGYLPRSGKGLTTTQISLAIQTVYNIDPTFALTLSTTGIALTADTSTGSTLLTPVTSPLLGSTWDLNNLDLHNTIEHDASLTRNDLAQGDNWDFQPTLLTSLLADSDTDYLSISSLARSRARREEESLTQGSGIELSAAQHTLAFGESALLLQAIGTPVNGGADYEAKKNDVKTWMAEERFPNGWKRPTLPITLAGTTLLADRIQGVTVQEKRGLRGKRRRESKWLR